MLTKCKTKLSKIFTLEDSKYLATKQPTPCNLSRWLLLLIYWIYGFIAAWSYFGWAAFVEIFFEIDLYGEHCPIDRTSFTGGICDAQLAHFARLFTLAYTTHNIFSFFAGILVDTIGPRFTMVGAMGLQTIAWILLGFGKRWNFAPYASFFLLGLTSDMVYLSIIILPTLFPTRKGAIASLLGGAASASSGIGPLIRLVLYGINMNPLTFFPCYGAFCIGALTVAAWFVFPRHKFVDDDAIHRELHIRSNPSPEAPQPSLAARLRKFIQETWTCASQPSYILVGILYAGITFCTVALFEIDAVRVLSSGPKGLLHIALPLSFFTCLMFGVITDRIGIAPTIILTNLTGVLCFAALAIGGLVMEYTATLFYMLFASFFTLQFYLFNVKYYEICYAGRLSGLCCTFGGITTILGGILYEVVILKHFSHSTILLPIFCGLVLAFSFLLIISGWRLAERANAKALVGVKPASAAKP